MLLHAKYVILDRGIITAFECPRIVNSGQLFIFFIITNRIFKEIRDLFLPHWHTYLF